MKNLSDYLGKRLDEIQDSLGEEGIDWVVIHEDKEAYDTTWLPMNPRRKRFCLVNGEITAVSQG